MKVALVNGVLRIIAAGVVVYGLAEVVRPWLDRHDVVVVIRPAPALVPAGPVERRT